MDPRSVGHGGAGHDRLAESPRPQTPRGDARAHPKARPLPSATWQDHGVRHVAHVVRNSGEAAQPDDFTRGAPADGGPSAEGVDDEAWRIFWSQALEDNQAHMAAALALLAKHLARVPKGSVVLEVGSRCGDVTVDMARRFPALQVQPTESTGRAATGLFLMLQERVLEYNTELSKDAHRDVPKILAPTRLDTAAASRWSVEFGRQGVGSVFAINVCQFMSAEALAALIHGCKSILSRNGFVFLCGPMLPIGEAVPRDSDLLYNEALRKFMEEVQIREADLVCMGVRVRSELGMFSICSRSRGRQAGRQGAEEPSARASP